MKILPSDIPDDIQAILDIVGMDNLIQILKLYGGDRFYLPTYSSVIKKARNREIRKRYNGKNIKLLALEYKTTASTIKNIIKNEDNLI